MTFIPHYGTFLLPQNEFEAPIKLRPKYFKENALLLFNKNIYARKTYTIYVT